MDFARVFFLLWSSSTAATKVQTNYGPIEGSTITLFNGEEVDAFLGVPYAAPPIKENRFAPPKPVTPWTETLKTQAVSKSCFQAAPNDLKKFMWFFAEEPESEDCLYLNIWKPCNCVAKTMAVMIWIHPGGFFSGSASMLLYDGAVLASEKNVIVVSMNYRLTMFGGLYLDIPEAPGNVGLQDQIQAIKWVSENIGHFGGDKNRITLFGESAGALSISLHLCNEDVADHFQYGILQSGSLNMASLTLTKGVAMDYSLSLGKSLGCPVDHMWELLSCLRKKSVEDLLKNYNKMPVYGKFPFNPVRNGKEVPSNPLEAVRKLKFITRKKLIMGNIPVSATAMIPMFFPGKLLTDNLTVCSKDMRAILKKYLVLNDERLQNIVIHEYTNFNLALNVNQFRDQGIEVFSDTMFTCPNSDFAKGYAAIADLYYFWFTHKPSKPLRAPVPAWAGTMQGDEIPFIFGAPLDPSNGYTAYEQDLCRKMMAFWVNFAKNGNPNKGKTVWPIHKPSTSLSCLEFGSSVEISKFPKEKDCAFWREIYPDLLTIDIQIQGCSDQDVQS